MKKIFAVAPGLLTAIGGFVDIGDLVTNAVVGSRFGMSLGWVVMVSVVGMSIFAHMAGKVTALSGRATRPSTSFVNGSGLERPWSTWPGPWP